MIETVIETVIESTESRILNYIEEHKEDFIIFLQKLVKIPSVTGYEKEAQEFIFETMKDLGAETKFEEPDVEKLFEMFPKIAQIPSMGDPELDMPLLTEDTFTYKQLMESEYDQLKTYKNRPNVIGVLKGTGGGKSLILNGHVDVVPEGNSKDWRHKPFSATIVNGKLYGRGSSDMKGGLAAMIKAVEAIVNTGISLKGDIMLQSVVNEEHSGNGSLDCIARGYKADASIVTEPSGSNMVITESGGCVYWQITFKWCGTHVGSRWQGKNQYGVSANRTIPFVLNKLLKLERNLNKDEINMSLRVGKITEDIYADTDATDRECIINGVAYYSPNLGIGEVGLKKVKELLKEAISNFDDNWLKENPPKILFQHYDDAYRLGNEGNEIKSVLLTAGKDILEKEIKCGKLDGGCDARHFVNRGKMAVLIYGPGNMATAHSVDENIDIDDYINSIKVLALTVYRWSK